MLTFRARHLATMTGPVIEDGCVVVDGDRIIAVGAARDIKPSRIDHDIDGLLMPGLINAHTHLELTNVPRPEKPGTFQDWLLTTMRATWNPDPVIFRQQRETAVREGIAQCLRFGVTSVGDITGNVDIVRPILADAPIRSISYGECLGLGERRGRFDELLAKAQKPPLRDGNMQAGVSPHSPYTVDGKSYLQSYIAAFQPEVLKWTTHLAETVDELEFVRDRSGGFCELYAKLGFDPGPPEQTEAKSIIEWLYRMVKPLDVADLLVHVNYCSDDDLDLLAHRRPLIAFCPRTHAYFGHPPHRWREMLQRGIAVCVATDSCASSPDLNIVDDLRLLHRQQPDVDPLTLWRMVTINPGRLFHWPPSKPLAADLCAWPTLSTEPLREILDSRSMVPSNVWIGGVPVPSPGTPGEG